MDIEKELAHLNNLPEDEQIKGKIRSSIIRQAAPKKRGNVWKDIAMIVAICSVAFFLLVTGTSQTNQATNNEIQHIYTYFGGKEDQFRARTSTLYRGVQEIKNDTITTFFKQIETMEKMEKGYLGDHIVDVIVVRNNEQHRYQMSNVSLYDVDNGIYYKGDGALFGEAFQLLYKPKINSYYIILPLGIIAINLLAWAYYQRRKIKVENPVGNNWGYMVLILASLAGVFAYSAFVGPLYKPFLIVLAILYGYIILKIIRRHSKTYIIVKIESYKAFALTILLIIYILKL
ncbi:hypothetical protein CSE16_11270 [Solibacillus sp. R5-41]|uniref:hypothetical protein n=1 Tax=Solibacillus sp. R5-41 TaxID=2048654 RepID=UPI000C126FAB|nr:hypothetical protein [Solibacillus sp. R5-41]ATP40582.1 hypothetical protein CSE16_11270 [Solibacillus sp. R5-41]